MGSTRDKSGREVMGWLEGGYQTLIDALESEIVALGGEVRAGATVESIAAEGGRAVGVVVDGRLRRFDHVLCTLAPPMARRLLAPELAEQAPADHCRYLGVVCLAAADDAQRQPVLPPEHHRPARPADDDRRDDARRRPGAGRRPPPLRLQVRRPGSSRPGARRRRSSRRSTSGYARTIFPDLRDDEIVSTGRAAGARHRARSPRRRGEAAAGDVLRCPGSRSRRRRTSTRRSSAARP